MIEKAPAIQINKGKATWHKNINQSSLTETPQSGISSKLSHNRYRRLYEMTTQIIYSFGSDPIETTANWFVVHYMLNDGTGDYYGRQFFDDMEDARAFVTENGGEL